MSLAAVPTRAVRTACSLLIAYAIGSTAATAAPWPARADALSESEDPPACLRCHTPAGSAHIRQWEASTHRRARLECRACHAVGGGASAGHPGVPADVTRTCGACHDAEAAAFSASRHAQPVAAERAPTCVHCHSAIGDLLAEDGAIRRTCARCHRDGASAGREWVPTAAVAALDLLRQVTLAFALLDEAAARARLADRPRAEQEEALATLRRGFDGLAAEWHRFDLRRVETRTRRLLDALEEVHRELDEGR